MTLIRELGKRNNKDYGLYECSECLGLSEIRKDTVNYHNKNYSYPKLCSSCANSKAGRKRLKHGDSNSRLYKICRGLKDRVTNPNNPKASIYYGKGFEPSWESYENFKLWAQASGYNDTLTIDRIDSKLGYFESNCQWLSLEENSGKDATRDSFGKNKTIKISNNQVSEIIQLSKAGFTHQIIADKYKVARTTVGAIIRSQSATTILVEEI